jgi:hypothetical protein
LVLHSLQDALLYSLPYQYGTSDDAIPPLSSLAPYRYRYLFREANLHKNHWSVSLSTSSKVEFLCLRQHLPAILAFSQREPWSAFSFSPLSSLSNRSKLSNRLCFAHSAAQIRATTAILIKRSLFVELSNQGSNDKEWGHLELGDGRAELVAVLAGTGFEPLQTAALLLL